MSVSHPLVLVVEDEPQMRRFLRPSLTAEGFKLLEAETVADALLAVRTRSPQLLLLDLGLPDGDGVELTLRIRHFSRVPIIVISARGHERDKVRALDAGADDYLTKPFGVKELLARIRVAFRHSQTAREDPSPVLNFGPLRVDTDRHEVTVNEQRVHLTQTEYRLLVVLARNAGKVLTHRQILQEVWGPEQEHMSHYVVVRMAELRKKIEADPRRPKLLLTEPGIGYRLCDDGSENAVRR